MKVEIEISDQDFEWLDKLAHRLRMRDAGELLTQEINDLIATWQLWADRMHIAELLNHAP